MILDVHIPSTQALKIDFKDLVISLTWPNGDIRLFLEDNNKVIVEGLKDNEKRYPACLPTRGKAAA
jgi:hypothetical protein